MGVTAHFAARVSACALVVLAACAPPEAEAPVAKTVSLRMTGSPPQATVTIDDILVGQLNVVAARGVAMPVGVHHISVEAPGFLPWDKEVKARDAAVKVEAVLEKIPD